MRGIAKTFCSMISQSRRSLDPIRIYDVTKTFNPSKRLIRSFDSWVVNYLAVRSQQLLCRSVTVLVLNPQAKHLCLQLPVRSSRESAQFMLRNHSDLEGRQAALFVKQLVSMYKGS